MRTAHELCIIADLTYRQVDYWTRTGYLTPAGDRYPGSGNAPRTYTDDQVALAVQMSRVIKAGIPMPAAHEVAEQLLATGRAHLGGLVLNSLTNCPQPAGEPLPDVVRHLSTGDTAA